MYPALGIFKQKQYIGLILLIFILYIILMPRSGYTNDIEFWKNWTIYSFQHGVGNIYNSDTDYLPLYHYILALFGFLQGSVKNIEANIHYLKIITLVFDFIGGIFVFKVIQDKFKNQDQALIKSLFYFLNIGIFYNTIIWGQVDGIMSCFIFTSFYYAYHKRILLSLILFIIAVNFKLQAIIFLPLIGLLVLPSIINQFSFKRFFYFIIVIFSLQFLIVSPFIYSGNVGKLWEVVKNSFGKYPVVSANAYNMWLLLRRTGILKFLNDNIWEISDSKMMIGLSLKNWGFILFFFFSFLSLFHLLKSVFISLKNKIILEISLNKTLITGALIPILFFYFNTEMHERYSHPAFIFLMSYCILQNRPLVGTIGLLAYLLNLEGVRHFIQPGIYETIFFSPSFISGLYLLTIILLYLDLWGIKYNLLRNKTLSFNKFK